ncbi:MAG TPA: indolepyruvate ferredoxin oxidoreductase subunit alpha [Chloroflexia bacterium]|nr:indolepyruvate ferredoxin oxidoreductase subunit alpha [Chloroflexia bacterium]
MGRNYSKETLAQLRFGQGQTLKGDMALIVLKAMLESGVAYMGGYPGAPTSSIYDAMSDAYEEVLKPMGVYVEGSVNEAAAAALLQASVNNPVRGAVNWKVVGNNVAADALAHVAHPGLKGGAMAFVGEDYGLNSTSVAERSLPYAHKSGLIAIDPRADAQVMARMVREGYELSEASGAVAFYLFRTRTGNLKVNYRCQDNRPLELSALNRREKLDAPFNMVPIPPYSQAQERRKFEQRMPVARKFIHEHGMNEVFPGQPGYEKIGIITHGMVHNTLARCLAILGEGDELGHSNFAELCLNVIHPLVPEELVEFMQDKEQVLIIEEGMPNLIEEQIRAIAQSYGLHNVRIYGKDVIPEANELVPMALLKSLSGWLSKEVYGKARVSQSHAVAVSAGNGPDTRVQTASQSAGQNRADELSATFGQIASQVNEAAMVFEGQLPTRLPIFCTGCPERPIFTALKLSEKKHGTPYYAGDIGCYVMGAYPPFDTYDSCTGMGTGLASAGAMGRFTDQKTVALLGDGTFWHSGLTTSIGNAVYNKQDAVTVIFENGWTSMTGQQENPNTEENARHEHSPKMDIEMALRGAGVQYIEEVNPYKVGEVVKTFDRAFNSNKKELKVIRSVGECQLEKTRHEKVEKKEKLAQGKPVTEARFGIDDDVCTGDHSCIRLNGCPSLTIKENPNPLRSDPIATIASSCVGCGLCGELAHAAVLCPSFYEAKVVSNPTRLERWKDSFSRGLIRLFGGAS